MNETRVQEGNSAAAALPEHMRTPSAVTLEIVLYALLIALACGLRLLALDGAPRPDEIPDMLNAWRGTASGSPALFWAQSLSFDLLGGSITSARLLTAIAGTLLALSPALFRPELGRTRALAFTLLLVANAPMIITARSASPVVWSALFGVLALRMWLSHIRLPDAARGTAAVVATAALLLLGDSSGPVFALVFAAGAALALLWHSATADSDTEAESSIARVGAAVGKIPWERALLLAALIVVAVASGFMTAPSALSSIAGLFEGIARLFQPDSADTFGISLFYQVPLWALAIAALFLNRARGWEPADRFFTGWLLAALLLLILLPGFGAAHTILLSLPLCGLVSGLAAYCFVPDRHQQMLAEKYAARGDELALLTTPQAGRFILMLAVFALLFILNVHLGSTAREFLQIEGGSISGAVARMQLDLATPDFRVGLLWSFIAFMFLLVGFFLAVSIWGNRVSAQGYGLGFLAMLAVSQLSGGWYAAVHGADDPVEPWNHEVTAVSYTLLERSLADLSFREAQGYPLLPITVLRDPATGLTEDGLLGWMLREHSNVRWVDSLAEAATQPIVIAPDVGRGIDPVQPDLGGSYVGQPFVITRRWSPDTMQGMDFLTWYLQRRVRVAPLPRLTVALWVRQDVFDSRPIQDLLD